MPNSGNQQQGPPRNINVDGVNLSLTQAAAFIAVVVVVPFSVFTFAENRWANKDVTEKRMATMEQLLSELAKANQQRALEQAKLNQEMQSKLSQHERSLNRLLYSSKSAEYTDGKAYSDDISGLEFDPSLDVSALRQHPDPNIREVARIVSVKINPVYQH